jgi:hypothetical protein
MIHAELRIVPVICTLLCWEMSFLSVVVMLSEFSRDFPKVTTKYSSTHQLIADGPTGDASYLDCITVQFHIDIIANQSRAIILGPRPSAPKRHKLYHT